MSKKFKAKKRINNLFKKILSFIILVLMIFLISFDYLYKKIINNLSEIQVIDILLSNNNDIKSILNNNSVSFLVNNSFKKEEIKKVDIPVIKEEINEPLIYIYNTHQTEEYRKTNNNSYNITPTVMHASLILQKDLEKLGISSIVEKNSIKEILDINAWN